MFECLWFRYLSVFKKSKILAKPCRPLIVFSDVLTTFTRQPFNGLPIVLRLKSFLSPLIRLSIWVASIVLWFESFLFQTCSNFLIQHLHSLRSLSVSKERLSLVPTVHVVPMNIADRCNVEKTTLKLREAGYMKESKPDHAENISSFNCIY